MAKKTSMKSTLKTARSTTKSAVKTSAKAATSKINASAMGLELKAWTAQARVARASEARAGKRGFLFLFKDVGPKQQKKALDAHLGRWQAQMMSESEAESLFFQGQLGPVWIVRPQAPKARDGGATAIENSLEKSSQARFRDGAGSIINAMSPYKLEKLIVDAQGLATEELKAALTGLEMGSYFFQENGGSKSRRALPQLLIVNSEISADEIKDASELGLAMNLARHYVNLSPRDLNPKAYADNVRAIFAGSPSMEVEIWEGDRLKKENMNLLLAVGSAAEFGPRLVHMRYRPKSAPENSRPIAIVGKGITFDSGGLDIKPSSAMRWMKKDMGGSAAAVAIAKWAERTNFEIPLDIYLSLAENAISGSAFRPGDVITSRNGLTVEISNTDAEGRLVLADAIDVAVSQTGEDQPRALINIATLTGAIKVGLGTEVAGLFSNNDALAATLFEAGLEKGDLMWRMPLFQPLRSTLKSTFADMLNSAESGWGGAITAALFLESFVKGTPWAHLDVYSWRDGANGAWSESGGNGQPVQALAEALRRMSRG